MWLTWFSCPGNPLSRTLSGKQLHVMKHRIQTLSVYVWIFTHKMWILCTKLFLCLSPLSLQICMKLHGMCINIVSISIRFQCNTQELCCQLSVHSGYSFQRPRCLQGMPQVFWSFETSFWRKNIDSCNILMACFDINLF